MKALVSYRNDYHIHACLCYTVHIVYSSTQRIYMSMITLFKRSLFVTGFASLIGIAGLFKISFMVGSQAAWFSGTNCMAPLAGLWGGFFGSCGVFALRMAWRGLFYGFHITQLFQGIPSLCASTYFVTSSYLVRLGIPIACM